MIQANEYPTTNDVVDAILAQLPTEFNGKSITIHPLNFLELKGVVKHECLNTYKGYMLNVTAYVPTGNICIEGEKIKE
jgi:hypothetical protein